MEIVDLSRYEVQETLGKGGMGEVLLATDTRLNRKVAIKRMLGDATKSQTAVRRFLTEAQSIAALNHFNIVQIHDYGRDKDGPFLIMEYVDGGSLLDKCREGALPLEEAVELTCQLCDGLSRAHDAGIIHRDIKPANVLLTSRGEPKLTDFGLARQDAGDTGQTMAGAVLGTLDFMPPEQRKDATLTDNRSDLWSLAATLYQMVTGEPPRVIDLDEVPQQFRPCLAQALKQKQDDRYQNAREFRDALRAAQQGVGSEELEEGSCPSCGTKNPTSRKFCRECATSLEAECLSCSAVLPMWEKVCDSCGTKQVDLQQQRRDSMASSQSEAESLLKVYDFDRATALATALRDEPDPRLQHLKSWAEKFLPQIEQGRQHQLERISEQLKEAAVHEQAHDHAAALRVLEQVPEILRETQVPGHSDTVSGVMNRLQAIVKEIKRLDSEIRQRVKRRKVNGLLNEVDRLLELQPDRQDLRKLKIQLLERKRKLKKTRDEAYAAAKQKLSAQDYDGVLEEISQIDESMLTEGIRSLRETASSNLTKLRELDRSIGSAIDEKQTDRLSKLVDQYLALKPDDAKMLSLQTKLQARSERLEAKRTEAFAAAKTRFQQCDFSGSQELLSRFRPELRDEEIDDLLIDCQFYEQLQTEAVTSLDSSLLSGDFQRGIDRASNYKNALSKHGLIDSKFAELLDGFQHAFEEQRVTEETEEAEHRQKALRLKLAIGASAVTLLLAAGLWMRSSLRASALAEAVQQQQWDEALAIDERHVPTLIGRADQRLDAATPDIEGAFADISLAEQIDSTVAEIKPVKALAYAKRAASLVTDGKIADAEKDLKEAQALGVPDSQIVDTQYNLGTAYSMGRGVPEDYAEAVKWWLKAAEQGHVESQVLLGLAYSRGKGISQDYTEAVRWHRKAAEQGQVVSQSFLGIMYYEGEVVSKDHTEAAKWYRKAAEQGNAQSQFNLGVIYRKGDGVAKDDAEAVKWFRKAAEQDYADAQAALGVIYYQGEGVAKDDAEAARWYGKAAEQDNAESQYALGIMYYQGEGVPKDHTEAVKWFRKAAGQGHAGSQFNLGVIYGNGYGVAKDEAEAYAWFAVAAENGYDEANDTLPKMKSKLTPEQLAAAEKRIEEFRIFMQPGPAGLGAALRSEDGNTFVVSVITGGAANKDGRLEVGDQITAVAQETGDFVDIAGMILNNVIPLIRGKQGSKVRLQVVKVDTNESVIYEIIRDTIEPSESALKGKTE